MCLFVLDFFFFTLCCSLARILFWLKFHFVSFFVQIWAEFVFDYYFFCYFFFGCCCCLVDEIHLDCQYFEWPLNEIPFGLMHSACLNCISQSHVKRRKFPSTVSLLIVSEIPSFACHEKLTLFLSEWNGTHTQTHSSSGDWNGLNVCLHMACSVLDDVGSVKRCFHQWHRIRSDHFQHEVIPACFT